MAYSAPQQYDPGSISTNCFEWTSIDALPYGGVGLDEFATVLNSDGDEALSVEPRAFRVPLPRV